MDCILDRGVARIVGCDEENIIFSFRFVSQGGCKAVLSILFGGFVEIMTYDVFWISPILVVAFES